MKTPHPAYRIVLFSLMWVLASCGGGGPSTSIDVTITDFAFTPNAFTVPAGGQISFSASNNGAVEHDFIIMKLGYQVKDKFTDADKSNVYWQKEHIGPGQAVSDTFIAPDEPGDFQIICGIAGHFQAGMVARLTVVKQP